VKISEGVNIVEGIHKAPGGLVRASVAVRDGSIDGILLSGDFFMEPAESLQTLQDALVGVEHNEDSVLTVVKANLDSVDAPGLDATDVTAAIMATPPT
jgi:lipoate-protein ligase A